MTGTRVIGILIAVLLATAGLPPFAAWTVHQRRVQRAEAELAALADRLRPLKSRLDALKGAVDVLCGPGEVPKSVADGQGWILAPRAALASVFPDGAAVPVDPWGNCFMLQLTGLKADDGRTIAILTAGPDGIIETAFDGSRTMPPRGNDLSVSLQY